MDHVDALLPTLKDILFLEDLLKVFWLYKTDIASSGQREPVIRLLTVEDLENISYP